MFMDQNELGFYQSLKEERKERKSASLEENMKAINESGLPYETRNNGTVILFRLPGKPDVDFYPTTNHWHIIIANERLKMDGNAKKFLKWFEKQHITDSFRKTDDMVYTNWEVVKAKAIKFKKTIVVVSNGWILK